MKKKRRNRNYSFHASKKLAPSIMTEINGVQIPSVPGTCYHAILCTLVESQGELCTWEKVYAKTEKFMRQYGGDDAWEKFQNKKMVKDWKLRIRENCHTLTRAGKNCYGYRLHEKGMAIYYFQDGVLLLTGGKLVKNKNGYDVKFPDGRRLQKRHRGRGFSYREYKRFVDLKYIDGSCKVMDGENIMKFRWESAYPQTEPHPLTYLQEEPVAVSILLDDSYDQDTANRLHALGLVVTDNGENSIDGILPASKVNDLMDDEDVKSVSLK